MTLPDGYDTDFSPSDEPEEPFALSLDDFIAAKSETPPALLGVDEDIVLSVGGLLILAGRGGKGKTTMTIEAALHLASGVEWLGISVPRPVRMLFITPGRGTEHRPR